MPRGKQVSSYSHAHASGLRSVERQAAWRLACDLDDTRRRGTRVLVDDGGDDSEKAKAIDAILAKRALKAQAAQ